MITELEDFKKQISQNNHPKPEVLEAKLKGVKEIEDECQIDDTDVLEWDGKKDKIYEAAFDEGSVVKREYNEHQISRFDASEYGYGFWLKFMFNVPKR